MWPGMWMTSCTGSVRGGFREIWKSQQLRTRLRTGRVDLRGSLRPDEFVRYGHCIWWGADEKVIVERLCISLPNVETFNSKVIKGFVPELRSRYVFFVFRDSYFLCIYVMNILCTFPVFMCGYVTPHLSSSLTDSLPSLNLLCHSKTDARFMQDGRKAVWSIPYVSVAFFPSLKQNFIAYCSSKVSSRPDCIFEIHPLWQSGFIKVYSNSCCSCLFEAEIKKIGLSSHKMSSNNILNFQESMTILNACAKKYGNLLKVPRIWWWRSEVCFRLN